MTQSQTQTPSATPLPSIPQKVLARATDYLIWGILSAVAIRPFYVNGTFSQEESVLAYFISFALYPVVEAFLVSRFGATAGGRLTGLSILSADGSKLPFKTSLKRAYLVFAAGTGLFLPLISVLCPLVALYFALTGRQMIWDEKCSSAVSYAKPKLWGYICLIAFYILLAVGCSLTAYRLYENRYVPSVEEKVLIDYLQKATPLMRKILESNALASPENVQATARDLANLQDLILTYRESYEALYIKQLEKIEKLPENKQIRAFHEIDGRAQALRELLYEQSLRTSTLETIISFFAQAEGRYRFENGQPVFEDPELMSRYQDFLLSLSPDEGNGNADDLAEEASEEVAEGITIGY